MDISSIAVVLEDGVIARIAAPPQEFRDFRMNRYCFVVELPWGRDANRTLALVAHLCEYIHQQKFYVDIGGEWNVRRNAQTDWTEKGAPYVVRVNAEIVAEHYLVIPSEIFDHMLTNQIEAMRRIVLAGLNDAIIKLRITDVSSIGKITLRVLI